MKYKRIILCFLIANILSATAHAQKLKVENLPKFDTKWIHFGFSLGFNSTDFIIHPVPDFNTFDTLRVIESEKKPGFNLGIISDLHLGSHFNLRFLPALSFAQRNLEYTYSRGDTFNYKKVKPVESTFLEFPLNLKYRSARVNNFAAYVLGGVKYSIDLASQKDVDNAFSDEIVVKLRKHDYSYEMGFGLDFFLEYFKFSPELKVSFGVRDLLIHDSTQYSDPLRKLNSRILLISLNFEG